MKGAERLMCALNSQRGPCCSRGCGERTADAGRGLQRLLQRVSLGSGEASNHDAGRVRGPL